MSELIKRDDVQREIQASFDGGAFRWQDGQDLMDRINAIPAASPWHRVEDELPELKELLPRYFVSGMCVLYNADTESFDIGFAAKLDFGDAEVDWKALYVNNPTHWMPIEPPKEDADADK